MRQQCYKILAQIDALQRHVENLPPISHETKQDLQKYILFSDLPETAQDEVRQFMHAHDNLMRALRKNILH